MHEVSPEAWEALVAGVLPSLPTLEPDEHPEVLFPGAFNPLHDGHRKMAQVATQQLGCKVSFELSIKNVDKPPLALAEVHQRLAQFAQQRVVLTSAATFVEKARLFPSTTFLVGIDTIMRIGEPRFYRDSNAQMENAIDEITDLECRFLVFGRTLEGRFHTLSDVEIPRRLKALCDGLSESQFRRDVASRDLRGL